MWLLADNAIWTFFRGLPDYAWLVIMVIFGIAGIVAGGIIQMNHKHRERMEMIRNGIDPRDRAK